MTTYRMLPYFKSRRSAALLAWERVLYNPITFFVCVSITAYMLAPYVEVVFIATFKYVVAFALILLVFFPVDFIQVKIVSKRLL